MHVNKTGQQESRNLFITILLNFVISVAELIGGLFSNSLSLISDALHNFSDGFAMIIAWIAVKVSRRDSNVRKTFGYKRIQILSALFNAIILIVICVFLIYEAILRFKNPEEVKSVPMFVVATIGLIANLVGVFLLKKHSKRNLNIKSAYLHLMGDTLGSVAVIVGGILIYFFKAYWIDPLITILISLYIIKETVHIVVETYNILMQGTPKNIDIKALQQSIEELPEIKGIHHIHVWNLSDQEIHFEAHVDLNNDMKTSTTEPVHQQIEKLLKQKFQINHVTLQFEYNFCDNKDIIFNGDDKPSITVQ